MAQVSTYALTAALSGLATRQQIANVLLAVQSANSGGTAPSNPVEGMVWRDTSNASAPIYKVYRLGAWVTLLADIGITATAAQINAGIFYTGATAPSSPVEGSRWRDTSNASAPVDKVYRLGAWVTLLADIGITAAAAQINPLGNAFDNAFLGAGSTGNLAKGAAEFSNPAYWLNTRTDNGITLTRVGLGIDTNGCSYVDYSVVGTPTTGSYIMDVYVQQSSVTAATLGQVFTTSCLAQIVGGTVPTDANTGIRVQMRGQTALAVQTETFFTATTRPTAQTLSTLTSTLASATTAQIICGVTLRVQSGVTANFTIRISGLQFDSGSSRLNYPFKALSAAEARSAMGLAFDGNGRLPVAVAPPWAFTSSQQTITVGSTLTVAHGLGAKPTQWQVSMICTTADLGYAVGDEIQVPFIVTNVAYGAQVAVNATNMIIRTANSSPNGFLMIDASFVYAVATMSSWRYIVRASL